MQSAPQHPLRLGVSMRVVRETRYHEDRDALAWDWGGFLSAVLPHAAWLPVPNLGKAVGEYLNSWNIQGLILTGGDELGDKPRRDQSERTMLDHARLRGLPVFGVCRGMQCIHAYFGGSLQRQEAAGHLGGRHQVTIQGGILPPGKVEVNSFHANRMDVRTLPACLTPIALDEEGFVEAFFHTTLPWAGVMWHPEREPSPGEHDCALLAAIFSRGEAQR